MKNLLFFSFCLLYLIQTGCKPKTVQTIQIDPHLEFLWETDSVFKTPESVLYDSVRQVIYVSNLNLNPRQKDENGSIGRITTDGEILEVDWVTGLSSPKGMALVDSILWVTDVDELVSINVNSGTLIAKIPVEGAGMLNDLTSDPDGVLYFSDSDGNVIYKMVDGLITPIISEGLKAPNGLLWENERLLLVSMGSQDFALISDIQPNITVITTGIGKGDGIVKVMNQTYLTSDWAGEVFLIKSDGSKISLLKTSDKQINSADIDYIPSMNLLLIPTFFKNKITAYKLVN